MQTLQLSSFKTTLLESPSDITKMPLSHNLFGINNKIYANLGSYNMSEDAKVKLSSKFTPEELEYPCLNRLFEVHIFTRTHDDKYGRIENMDFVDYHTFMQNRGKLFQTVYASFNDSERNGVEPPIYCVPLNAKVLRNASNYAWQEINRLSGMAKFL